MTFVLADVLDLNSISPNFYKLTENEDEEHQRESQELLSL